MPKSNHPVMLIVLDGWGYSDSVEDNAIHSARTPNWDKLWQQCPHTLIHCSGTHVGLPDEQMGNSEVGHMHIGAGRLIDQDYSRIGKAIRNGEFETNTVLRAACDKAKQGATRVHIMGLLSPGGVHSHEDHVIALVDLAHKRGAREILVHAFLDGRDTPPQSAAASIKRLEEHCAALGNARVASVTGRYYAMDRNQNWDRMAAAYQVIVSGEAKYQYDSASAALAAAYARDETDEFVKASLITDTAGQHHCVNDGDVVIFANFRADRARQLTTLMTAAEFDGFERGPLPTLAAFVTMTDYGEQFSNPVAYSPIDLPKTFGEVVAVNERTQLRIAETEKYAHVTFFFNGGEERVFDGEQRVLVPSPDVSTYDLKPEMSALEVTDKLVEAISSDSFDAIICNYANADMVGHTGVFDATVKCVETLDSCLGRVISAAREHGMDVLITADHGNAEKMRNHVDASTSNPHTAHTSNLVPLVYVGRKAQFSNNGSLVDLAPTMLALMGLPIPAEMTGTPLLSLSESAQDAA